MKYTLSFIAQKYSIILLRKEQKNKHPVSFQKFVQCCVFGTCVVFISGIINFVA